MDRIILFLLRVAISPLVLAIVVFVAWCFSFLLAAIGICEAGSNSTPVSTAMVKDFDQFINFVMEVMGLK